MQFITNEKELEVNLPQRAFYFYRANLPYHSKYVIVIEDTLEKPDLPFFAIDLDQFPKFIHLYNLEQLPTIFLLKNHRIMKKIKGYHSTAKLADICKAEPQEHKETS